MYVNSLHCIAPDESPPVMSDRGSQDVSLVTMGFSRVLGGVSES